MRVRKINLLRDVEPLVEMSAHYVARPHKTKHYLESVVKCGGTVLIAEENEERVGFIVLEIIDSPFEEKLYGQASFYYIDPSKGQKTVLEGLITGIETWCEARRLPRLEIRVKEEDKYLKEIVGLNAYHFISRGYQRVFEV
ncbi:hypothetical protein Amet_4618 [Alkaliphilus metalliredigens QYMF]|uniref:N-acetyltransferase domain-containing protein n=1 Tax=Alkaliphilus metalliredigens (strain QYMF) TaxID=293826 RepID=A6TWX1_ALKMQ|nr:hypothetical protein [Alkaliphilus metalliredigens]ABR50689.1 hypothetical protein Amet_4618 [Alkaliphilus metalliredigens QYMF]